MRISDWSSDVCSSDLIDLRGGEHKVAGNRRLATAGRLQVDCDGRSHRHRQLHAAVARCLGTRDAERIDAATDLALVAHDAVERGGVEVSPLRRGRAGGRLGRAPWRERVCPYVYISVVTGTLT